MIVTQNKKRITKVGWGILSILFSFLFFSLAMWSTAGHDYIIVNLLTLLFTFIIYALLLDYRKVLLGVGVLFLTLIILEPSIRLSDVLLMIVITLGVLIGGAIRMRKIKIAVVFFSLASIFLFFVYNYYYTHIEFETNQSLHLSKLENKTHLLVGKNNQHPAFYSDTVYLINFSFLNCKPCRLKKPFLEKIAKQFKNSPFKIVNIHSFESKEIFDTQYSLSFGENYHDIEDAIAKSLGVYSAPTGFIFNKKQELVRRYVGFGLDNAQTYLEKTQKLIKKLINEKKAYLLPTNIDLGKISCQKTKKIELKVVNPSSKTITIEGVSKSCSCTDVEVSSYNVKPNSHSTISLVYNPIDDFQKVKKSIIIRTSDGQILSFKFEADVLAQ